MTTHIITRLTSMSITSPSTPGSDTRVAYLHACSSSSDSAKLNGKSISKKTVHFAADTLVNRENNVAITISRHLYVKELGYTQYHIQVMYKGIQWTIYKRYRDFEAFHTQILNSASETSFPPLPKKRWFERQRWLNKFDESYSLNRRVALQDYLRNVARMPVVRDKLTIFREFLQFPPEALQAFEEEMARGEVEQHQYICYEQDGNGRLVLHRPGDKIGSSSSSSSSKNLESALTNPSKNEPEDCVKESKDDPDEVSEDDGYFEDDETDDHEEASLTKHSGVRGMRARDSLLETRLEINFDDEGNPIQDNVR